MKNAHNINDRFTGSVIFTAEIQVADDAPEALRLGAATAVAIAAKADLNCADLRLADLNCADLNCADLNCADLSEADLSGANLSEADLSGANLRHADLRHAVSVRPPRRGGETRLHQPDELPSNVSVRPPPKGR